MHNGLDQSISLAPPFVLPSVDPDTVVESLFKRTLRRQEKPPAPSPHLFLLHQFVNTGDLPSHSSPSAALIIHAPRLSLLITAFHPHPFPSSGQTLTSPAGPSINLAGLASTNVKPLSRINRSISLWSSMANFMVL